MYRPLALAFLALTICAAAPTWAQLGPGTDKALMVVDGRGTIMGRFDGSTGVIMTAGTGWIKVALGATDDLSSKYFTWPRNGSYDVYFTQRNCAGDGWFGFGASEGVLPTDQQPPDSQGHVMLYVASSPELTFISEGAFRSRLSNGTCTSANGAGSGYAARANGAPIDLSTMFTPPFHLE